MLTLTEDIFITVKVTKLEILDKNVFGMK